MVGKTEVKRDSYSPPNKFYINTIDLTLEYYNRPTGNE